ncbi:hypothetical protein LB566_04165 [Mesorhizobium sp. CA13]|uniref:hypothetical protein n=1 Tax=unclassified Mesorhizobium TaxID=325217 RepID=UPI001CCA0EC4|nr:MULTISPECIES: hypothetical protein [unclassified Mesorhizobium]MBZ9852979.1 hypothetical protein [Mesorhizobium sp. CA13]MBZ9964935.1 hypothetical protein [Mesorhizobium sp. BR1-1-2]
MLEDNIWMASLEVYTRNRKWVVGYICLAGGLALLERFIHINSGASIFIGVVTSTFLAIPAHIAVLTQLDPDQVSDWLKERPKAFFSFVKRCLLLGLLGAIAPVTIAVAMVIGGVRPSFALLAALVVWVFSGIAAFAKWGTMLPAVIADDDQTLAVAGQRGSKVFGYAFPRLLISFGLVTVLFVAILMLLSSLLGIDPKDSSAASLILSVAGAIIGAYQIVMTSVVLSRSYLRARPPVPPARRMAFAFGR